jgi:hypothetical protein
VKFDLDWAADTKLFNIYEDDIAGGDGPSKLDRLVIVEPLQEKENGDWPLII